MSEELTDWMQSEEYARTYYAQVRQLGKAAAAFRDEVLKALSPSLGWVFDIFLGKGAFEAFRIEVKGSNGN